MAAVTTQPAPAAPTSESALRESQVSQETQETLEVQSSLVPQASSDQDTRDTQSHSVPSHAKARIDAGRDKIAQKRDEIRDKTSSSPPGGYDDTPLPPAHNPTYTVKFTFHRASFLPVADLSSTSSDPFIRATLTVPGVGKRHEQDPAMIHRTHTNHKTTEPSWEEDWVVAGIPEGPFKLKCRIYDEDTTDHDDRLGNVTVEVPFSKDWSGIDHQKFDVKKRMGSKRAYFLQAAVAAFTSAKYTPTLELSIQVIDGPTDQKEGARLYTVGPTRHVRHFSPMIGRITNTLVNRDEVAGEINSSAEAKPSGDEADEAKNKTKKYDFQACEIQLQGPVPAKLYHRYVEFRPFVGRMFSSRGLRGHILNKALHKQHNRVYNYSPATEIHSFKPCSTEAALTLLKLAHFDEGSRIFTYTISLDGIFRFTETGKEFGIDLLSKHTMHSDVATYIAFSGEFFIRRLTERSDEFNQHQMRSFSNANNFGQNSSTAIDEPGRYQLVIDNDSGTYRPEKSLLPVLQKYLEENFPGIKIEAMHWESEKLQKMKKEQHDFKKKAGGGVQMVMNRNSSKDSLSSSDESRLSEMVDADVDEQGQSQQKSNKELAWELLEDPTRVKNLHNVMHNPRIGDEGGA
ncbi:hypothetical protein SEPCBS119000_006637 [Sporothrix epigloea]|uniref:C2 domain-containing protein n=1 Tax=Sporothrix epigloea TaxID=1892477 RepID=A0ABP0E404_9PEZI